MATLTVIASMMPMAFVRGLMGPYMRPMPIGASLAMVFSLLVALTISPLAGHAAAEPEAAGRLDATGGFSDEPEFDAEDTGYKLHDTKIYRTYDRIMRPHDRQPRARACWPSRWSRC